MLEVLYILQNNKLELILKYLTISLVIPCIFLLLVKKNELEKPYYSNIKQVEVEYLLQSSK